MKKTLLLIISVLMSAGAMAYDFEEGGIAYNVISSADKTLEVVYKDGNVSGNVAIPASVAHDGTQYTVTSIASQAFFKCTGITSVSIPSSVTRYGTYIFTGCTSLKSIELPQNMTALPDGFLNQCMALTAISLPDGIKSIGAYSLGYCASLAEVSIPANVTELGTGALMGTAITEFTLPAGVTELSPYVLALTTKLKSVTLHDNLKTIGEDAFQGNMAITNIEIPSSVERIDAMAFASCFALTSVVIPDGVKALPSKCFYNDMALRTIKIGKGVTEIGADCFAKYKSNNYAPQLTDVYLAADALVSGGESFTDDACAQATLHVQPALVEAYKAQSGWERFGSIVALKDGDLSGIASAKTGNNTARSSEYTLCGMKASPSQRGIIISGGKKYLRTK